MAACALAVPSPASAQAGGELPITIFGGAFEGVLVGGVQAELDLGRAVRPALDLLFLPVEPGHRFGVVMMSALLGLPRNREHVPRLYGGLGGGFIAGGSGAAPGGTARLGAELPLGAERLGLRIEGRLYGVTHTRRPFFGLVLGIRIP